MEAEAEGEEPVVALIGSRLLQGRTASEELAAVAVRAVPVAVVVAPALRAAAASESSWPDRLPRFPITRSSAATAALAAVAEPVQRALSAATAQPEDWVRSSAPAVPVAAATVVPVEPDPAVAAPRVA
jgi:hypothetical protein